MTNVHAYTRFLTALERQTELMNSLTTLEEELQTIVAERRWDDLQMHLPRMTRVSDHIADAEEQRNDAFLDLALACGVGSAFPDVLAALPDEARAAISSRYRALKVAVLRLGNRTASMDAYLRSTIATNRGLMRELYPDQSPSGYSRDGAHTAGTAALVVDRHM